jgi:hypothetical protein
VDKKKYLSLIMSLMYLARLTRPDILLSVTYLASKSHNCTTTDWQSAIRVLKYLDGSRDRGIIIHCTELKIVCFCDASHGTHVEGKGHTGYVICMGDNQSYLASKSAKQKLVALSSTDAEVFAMTDCLKQAVWLRNVLRDLNLCALKPIKLYQDNKSAMIMISEPSKFKRSKHILIKISYARELVKQAIVNVRYLSTDAMFADMLTKPLHGEQFARHCDQIMGVR